MMSMIKVKCTRCGELLEADSALSASICPHCGKSYRTEEAAWLLEHPDFKIRNGKLLEYTGTQAEVELPGFVTKIHRDTFRCCKTLKRIVIPNGVRNIGACAFMWCDALESVTLPDSLEIIGAAAFDSCINLKQIDLPDNISVIGRMAFRRCGLTSISIPAVGKLDDYAFSGCTSLERVTFRGNVSKGGKTAFMNCSSLTSVEFPQGFTRIPDTMFLECASLREVTIPNTTGVFKVGLLAFGDCTSLEHIALPDGTTFIDDGAFEGCTSLKSVSFSGQLKKMGDDVFAKCPSLESLPPALAVKVKEAEGRRPAGEA